MDPGGVIVDLAAERGGNCALTQANQRVPHGGVVILGPTNLPAEVPYHASQMFAHNITKFLLNMVKDGRIELNSEDQIVQERWPRATARWSSRDCGSCLACRHCLHRPPPARSGPRRSTVRWSA